MRRAALERKPQPDLAKGRCSRGARQKQAANQSAVACIARLEAKKEKCFTSQKNSATYHRGKLDFSL